MFLRKFYTVPATYFDDITFNDGLNYVYGYRDKETKPGEKDSLNNIGKSTFLDMIDFSLASDFTTDKSPRLYGANEKGLLKGITVYLEFETDTDYYKVSRSFDRPSVLTISSKTTEEKEYPLIEIRKILCDIIFEREDYQGFYSPDWFRRLISFYIKILRTNKREYPDPFSYLEFTSEAELLQYHLFLLDINNRLAHNNVEVLTNISDKKKLVNTASKNFVSAYNFKNTSDVESKINQIRSEIVDLKEKINAFRLASSQQINADKANELTKEINKLSFENYSDQKKIDTYNESLSTNLSIRLGTVESIYKDLNELLATNIKKTLDEAVKFRKKLLASRKDFILEEIEKLKEEIKRKQAKTDELDKQRAEYFRILSTANAIKNLSDAYTLIESKEKEASNLEGQIKLFTLYTKELSDLQQNESKIESQIIEFRETIRSVEQDIHRIFYTLYRQLYPPTNDSNIFSFSINSKKDSKLRLNILHNNERHGKGKNRGRTLVYDFTVLLYSIQQNYKAPRFIIHDGIFDGVDKIHFVDVVNMINSQLEQGHKFQYIVTLNEEGVLTDKFDPGKVAAHEKIIEEAILKLTPDKPLFRKKF